MRNALFCSGVLAVLAVSARGNAAGQDHGGQDVTINADTTWDGAHTGIKTLTVAAGSTLKVTAGQPLEITADRIIIAGALSADGAGYSAVSGSSATGKNGSGPGGGGRGGATMFGGGGGGHAGKGGCGKTAQGCAGSGGAAYGSATDGLVDMGSSGGSSGGIAAQTPGATSGAGGGAVTLRADEIDISGTLSANGSDGSTVNYSGKAGSGGGAGGGLVLIAGKFDVTSTVSVHGGAGGEASCTPVNIPCSPGGGGGGGWIKVLYWGAMPSFKTDVSGGAGGPAVFSGESGAAGQAIGDALPTVQPNPPTVSGAGAIPIPFMLRDPEGDPCTVEATIEQNGTSTPATLQGAVPEGGPALTASQAGIAHTITWDAATDLPGFTGSVQLTLRANDGFAFGPPSTVTVQVGSSGPGDSGTPGDSGSPGSDSGNPAGDAGTLPPADSGSGSGPGGVHPTGNNGSCACSWAHRDPGAAGWWAMLALLGLWYRRRRQG